MNGVIINHSNVNSNFISKYEKNLRIVISMIINSMFHTRDIPQRLNLSGTILYEANEDRVIILVPFLNNILEDILEISHLCLYITYFPLNDNSPFNVKIEFVDLCNYRLNPLIYRSDFSEQIIRISSIVDLQYKDNELIRKILYHLDFLSPILNDTVIHANPVLDDYAIHTNKKPV
jgi:hypothetical protein